MRFLSSIRHPVSGIQHPASSSGKPYRLFSRYSKILFFFSVICISALINPLVAQDRLELIHADFSRGQMFDQKEEVKILEGSVHVLQDTVEIFCDRALYYRSEGKLILEGHVRLIRGSETLTAKKVTYYESRKLAIAEQNVRVKRPGQEMHSEYLEYYYETDQAFAKTNLLLYDEDSRAYVVAVQGEYVPQENRSKVEENAHFWQVDSSGSDTLHIYARVMEYFFQPERHAAAKDSVKIVRGDLIAYCDSALYLLDQERVFLEIRPRAQQKNNRLDGAQMELDLSGMELRQIMVRGNAVAISVDDSTAGKTNRLTGQEIVAFIMAQKIDQLWAYNNARSKYYLKEKETEQGVNVASADTIGLFFKEGELDYITVKGGSQGIYYPSDYKGKIESDY